jgi:hypothetical protein
MKIRSLTGLLVLLMALVTVMQPTLTQAGLSPYDGIGGNGGAPFRVDCGESAVLVGIIGQSGLVTDQVGGLCVKIDPVSGTWIGGVYETARRGGNGGGPFRNLCPVGNVLVGMTATVTRFNDSTVVGPIEIRCMELGIRKTYGPAVIMGTEIVFVPVGQQPSAPTNTNRVQDSCDRGAVPKPGYNERVYSRVGMALVGLSGLYVDRVHLECGEILQDTRGYRITFQSSSTTPVPEGTPLAITWRAMGVTPELTPTLQSSWMLQDWSHARSGLLGPEPTQVANPCVHAQQPCTSGWVSSASSSSVTFQDLPPAQYELQLQVSPTVRPSFSQVSYDTNASMRFEVVENNLMDVHLSPGTVRRGQSSTATITFEGPVPPRGKTLYLSSSNPDLLLVPTSVLIPGGSTTRTVVLHPNPNMLSGQATITVSLKHPLKDQTFSHLSKVNPPFSAQIRSRGTEAPVPSVEAQPEPPVEPSPSAEPSAQPERDAHANEPAQDGDVTERGIGALALKRTPSFTQKAVQVPIAPNIFPFAGSPGETGSVLARPNKAIAGLLTGPSNTKSAVLTIEADLSTRPSALPQRLFPTQP